MKYFLPDLLVRGNSRDIDEAENAARDWDKALKAYARRLRVVKRRLPGKPARFVDEIQLHDAEFMGFCVKRPDACFVDLVDPTAYAVVRNRGGLVVIAYRIAVEPKIPTDQLPPALASHPDRPKLWLYDEFDFDLEKNVGSHEIFFSDGSVVTLLFDGFDYDVVPLAAWPVAQGVAERSKAPIRA